MFFEVAEDQDPQIYLAPGIMPHWMSGGEPVTVRNAPTIFGMTFGYELHHDVGARTVTIDIGQPAPEGVRYIYPCRLGSGVQSAEADGVAARVKGPDVLAPPETRRIVVKYAA